MTTPRESRRPTTVVLALGSNLGDRLAYLRGGLAALVSSVAVDRVSAVYASDPVGLEEQPEFLNAVVVARTELGPDALLDVLQAAEVDAGRRRTVRGGPRTLDLDLIFFGDCVIQTERLDVPHPRWLERSFVRVPLSGLAPDLVDPVSGRTLADLCADRPTQGLRRYGDPSVLKTVS